MSCNTKLNLIKKLKQEEVIDNHGNVIDKNKFNVLNIQMSKIAENKYGVDLQGKNLLTLTRFKYEITNEDFFKQLDQSVNSYDPPKKIESLLDESKNDFLFTLDSKRSKKNEQKTKDERLDKINQTFFNGELGLKNFTAVDLINNISNNYTDLNDVTLDIISRLKYLSSRTNSNIKVIDKFNDNNSAMKYNVRDNNIIMSIDMLETLSLERNIINFLHEVVHSTSVNSYYNTEDDFQRLIFRNRIDYIFEEYKFNSKNSKSYGFTQPVEFIAEFYSNKDFRNEIKQIYDRVTNKSIFEKIIDAIRSLLGLPIKHKRKLNFSYNDVLTAIHEIVSQDESSHTGINYDIILKTENKEDIDIKIPTLETIEQKQNLVLDRIKASLTISLNEYKQYIKRNKDKNSSKLEKVKKSAEEFKDLKEKIEEYSKEHKWKAIITFTKTMNSNLSKLQSRLKKEDLNRDDARVIIERYENYLAAYNLLDEVSELISDEQYHNSKRISKKDRSQIEKLIADTAGKHKVLTNNFKSAIKSFVTKDLSTLKHQPEVEKKWKDKLTKQYKDLKIENKTLDEYIVQEMNNTYVEEIQNDVVEAANKTVNEVSFDISAATKYLNSAINTNSKLVQIFQNILNDIRNSIIKSVRSNDQKLKDLFDEFIKTKNSNKASDIYKNLLDQNSEGKYYLKGEYKVEFYKEWQDAREKGSKELKDWLKNNTDLVLQNGKIKGRKPSDKWKNDLSNLSDIEKTVLEFFQNQLREGDKKTFGINSLIDNFYNTKFYRLPAITKKDFERVLEGEVKGIVKDKWIDLTKIRPDDIGYQERSVRIDNSSINYVPIHYRGNIPNKEQSLDLFTIMRLEYQNTESYSIKQSKELELSNIISIAEQKRYVKTTGVRIPIIGKLFGGNVQTIKGSESETFKRLKSLMDRNIYDVLHIYAGNMGKIDVNKAIKFANSWTATVGLSLNTFSATANALNGNIQLLMETVGKNIFNSKDLAKANKKYLSDTPNILSDIKQPIKKSFSNQLNQEFDTFGLATVSEQSFIRSSYLKSFADPSSLQFMHQIGEHQMQSTLTMAVLNSVKVLDKDGNQIKNDNKSDMTLLDAYSNIDGVLKLDPRVVYTTHTPSIKYNEGGKVQINALIKKKIFDTMGNYDQQMQADATRYAAGKLFLMYRKYLMPLGIRRFRGFSTSTRSKDKLEEKDRFFSHSLKDYEEGIYTSLVRHISQGVLPAIKQLKYEVLSNNWDNLTESEKSNIKVAISEIILTGVLIPMLGGLVSKMAEGVDDEDEKYFYFVMYQLRRLESELAQYRDPSEAWKIVRSPIPSIRILESATEAVQRTIKPWTWDDKYKSGKRKGDLKIIRSYEKLIPILNRKDIEAKEMFKYINNNLGF